jgi:putative flippase GtrA
MSATFRQIFVFGLVGVTATVVHYLAALFAHEWLTLGLYTANLCGYLCAFGVSYIGHGRFTFRATLDAPTFLRFILTSVFTLTVSEVLLGLLESRAGLPHRISLAAAALVIPPMSFLLNKFWVYRTLTT